MKVGFVTNLRAPYRTLQFNEFSTIKELDITIYYCNDKKQNRAWKTGNQIKFKEVDLSGYRILKKYGYINKGIVSLIKENDFIILGGYEQPTYILISILCRLFKKEYILLFDGISTDRLNHKENIIKKYVKKIVINNSAYIMGNGTISRKYFKEKYQYPEKKIYNQYLTIDSEKINRLYEKKDIYRKKYRELLKIDENDTVLVYSGRLINIKNVDSLVKAISKLKKKNITLVIIGGGELEKFIYELSDKLEVNTIITGFISEQEEVFKRYFIGDIFVLPSVDEPWGLVVNEAMAAGLPVIVSNVCGCSLDMVKYGVNGYTVDPRDIDDISDKINHILKENMIDFGINSRNIINKWTFKESKNELLKIIKAISKEKL